jgi:uncharacterized SAM-binding protein YcdF (DUF218 family)
MGAEPARGLCFLLLQMAEMSALRRYVQRFGFLILIALVLIGYWFLPISGKVLIMPGDTEESLMWPQF